MRYYVGLDVGHRTTSISVIDKNGDRVWDGRVATDPKTIVGALRDYRRGCVRVGLESCSVAVWLAPELARLRLPVVCIEARHAHGVLKANLNKTDRNDARGIAQLVRTGVYRVVHLKAPETRHVQALLTVRRLVLAKSQDVENAIGGALRSFGLKVPRGYLKGFEAKVRAELRSDPDLSRIVEPLLELRTVLLSQLARMDGDVRAMAEDDPVCKRLMTAPGVGPIVAVTYRAVIDIPERFRRSQIVGAYLGLTPKTVQSGDTGYRTRISKRGDVELRRALYMAGRVVLFRCKGPDPLLDWGRRIAERRGAGKAIIALARRLAVILHRMWLDGSDYESRPTPA